MLFYIRCPTCSEIISYDLDKYMEELDLIRNDPNKTRQQKEELGAELLKKYGFTKLCHTMRIMSLIPYHEIIQT